MSKRDNYHLYTINIAFHAHKNQETLITNTVSNDFENKYSIYREYFFTIKYVRITFCRHKISVRRRDVTILRVSG